MRSHLLYRCAVAVASLALLTATNGCAQAAPGSIGPSTTSGPGPATYAPDDLVLRVEVVHGFMREYFVDQLPIVSVYGDGRVITEGRGIVMDAPAPIMRTVVVRRVSAESVEALVTRAVERGIGRDIDYGQPEIYDAPGTRFTVLTEQGPLVTDVYALGVTHGSLNLTDAQRSARQGLKDLLGELRDLPGTLGPAAVGEEEPYVPRALAAITREWTDSVSSSQPERVWPGPALPGEPMGMLPEVRCLTVTDGDVATVVGATAAAYAYSRWISEGQRWLVVLRPLLPDETSCADLI
jgi:hypothetical protein